MNLTVKRFGNELAVVLPEDVARKLNAVEGGSLEIDDTAAGVTLRPAAPRPDFKAITEDLIRRYDKTLRRLAE